MVTNNLIYSTTPEILNNEFNYYKNAEGKLSGYSSKNEIIKFFQQDNFYHVEKELWKNKEIKDKLIKNRIKYLSKNSIDDLNDNDILTGFKKSGIYYGYSHFNPLIFKWFIKNYNVKRCYDPCGGWGHRLLGAQNLELYIYNDLSYNIACSCQNIANYFNMTNIEWYNEDAKECWPANKFKFDSIFTCPPYLNIEHYECGDFKDYNDWAELIDMFLVQFNELNTVKNLGIVLREDLLPNFANNYNDKFLIPLHKSHHLMKKSIKYNNEYLYIWNKI